MTYVPPTVSVIAQAIGTAVTNGVSIPGSTSQIRYAPYLTDSVNPPVLLVAIDTVKYHEAMGGGNVAHSFILHLILSRSNIRTALRSMEAFMSYNGTSSVMQAVESDPTLGGVINSAIVTESGPPAELKIGQSGASYLSIPFKCEVVA